MWLLDVSTLNLHEFQGRANIPSYAILSHTWGDEEVSFRDWDERPELAQQKAGYDKIARTCQRAKDDGYQWAWVDTCCIDKRSSADLSEAINSMFEWYERAGVCYAFLADVPDAGGMETSPDADDEFSRSRWFTRGWTLQELIAPDHVIFFSSSWNVLGEKRRKGETRFMLKLSSITGIHFELLNFGSSWLEDFSVAQRMSWAAQRRTTREEDQAYCLMGLFGVNMPILYGEGPLKAFLRLQSEIISSTPDETIFAWQRATGLGAKVSGLLAGSPRFFKDCKDIVRQELRGPDAYRSYSVTNMGLSIEAALIRTNIKDPTLPSWNIKTSGNESEDVNPWVHIMPIGAEISDGVSEAPRSIGLYVVRVYRSQMTTRRTYRRLHLKDASFACGETYLDVTVPQEPLYVLTNTQHEAMAPVVERLAALQANQTFTP